MAHFPLFRDPSQSRAPRRGALSAMAASEVSRRRLLGGAGAVALGAGVPLLSSCGSDSGGASPGGGETLSFWQFHAPDQSGSPASDWFVDMVDAWNAENEVQVELRFIPSNDYINGNTLQTAFASGEGPDLFLISPGDFLRYYNGGALLDLTPFLEEEVINDYSEGVMATRMVDGKVYALPREVDPLAMFYSVDAFESAGLSEADLPTTWDQLLDVADRLTTSERFGVLFATDPGYYQNFTWYPFMWQGNPDVEIFDVEAGAAALGLWGDAVAAGVAPREALGTGGSDAAANLASGYCAMQQTGIWSVAQLEDGAPDFPYGVFRLPIPEGGTYVTDLGGWSFVANANGSNPEAAGRFIAWALGSMGRDSIERGVTWSTEARSSIPPRASVLERAQEDGEFVEGPLAVFADEIAPGGRSEPRFPPEVYRAISDAIQATQLGGADPMTSAETAAEQIDSFLQGYDGAPIL